MRAVALGLGLDYEDELLKLHSKKGNKLAFRHYPPVNVAKVKELGIPRLAAHKDFTPSIVLLFQDDCGGLEVQKPGSSEFIQVPPIKDTFVMNIGDVLMRWSNGVLKKISHCSCPSLVYFAFRLSGFRYHCLPALLIYVSKDYLLSTLHRVDLPPYQEGSTGKDVMTPHRYSIPFFVHPNPDTIMECFPSCCGVDNPP